MTRLRRRGRLTAELGQPLPASTDVLVIGGGLAGTALAYYLAREGVEVVLVERGELNREASGTNAGSFHFQIAIHQLTACETDNVRDRLLAEVRLHAEAAGVWSTLERELDARAGRARHRWPDGRRDARASCSSCIDKQEIEQEAGLETHVLAGAELREFAPYLADDLAGRRLLPAGGPREPAARRPAVRAARMRARAR